MGKAKFFVGPGWVLLIPALLLSGLGVVALSSMDPGLARQQLVFVGVGVVAFWLVSRVDYRVYAKFWWIIYGGLLGFIFLPSLVGTVIKGAMRWIVVGGLTIQPSVLAVPWLLVVLSSLAARGERGSIKSWLVTGIAVVGPWWLIFRQPDLGTALVLAAGLMGIWLVSGVGRRQLALLLVLMIGVAVGGSFLLRDYQKQRLASFWDPMRDPLGSGYHVVQSTIAVGSGRWWGRGFGQGTQSSLRFLPAAETDFIFAAIAEEFGLVGAGGLLILYLGLFGLVVRAVKQADDDLGRMIAGGIWGAVWFQALVNVGMNTGLGPVTGITLPGVSYGGSSLIAAFVSWGLVASVMNFSKKREVMRWC